MATAQDVLQQIETLELKEAELLFRSLSMRFPSKFAGMSSPRGIELTPGVCGGAARIVRTRIPVWVLEQMRRLGASEAKILESYPNLRAEDLVSAWSYVDAHAAEIDEQIRVNENA